jgi:hypothetical protein
MLLAFPITEGTVLCTCQEPSLRSLWKKLATHQKAQCNFYQKYVLVLYENTLANFNANVVAVNAEVVGLAPGFVFCCLDFARLRVWLKSTRFIFTQISMKIVNWKTFTSVHGFYKIGPRTNVIHFVHFSRGKRGLEQASSLSLWIGLIFSLIQRRSFWLEWIDMDPIIWILGLGARFYEWEAAALIRLLRFLTPGNRWAVRDSDLKYKIHHFIQKCQLNKIFKL